MKAVVFHDIGDIRLDEVPEPKIKDSTDAIVRLTASAICGTDLHLVRGTLPGMMPGTILGHEGVGIVEAIGPGLRNVEVGDRVVISSTIGCGYCAYCRGGDYSQCDHANPKPAKRQEEQFKKERDDVAPHSKPSGGNWQPGDAPSIVFTWAIEWLAKAGTFSIVGVYPDGSKTFPIGTAMNKNLTIRMGNCNHRKYIPRLVELVQGRAVDPAQILTHSAPLMSALDAYRQFDKRQEGWIKVMLDTAAVAAA